MSAIPETNFMGEKPADKVDEAVLQENHELKRQVAKLEHEIDSVKGMVRRLVGWANE